VISANSDWTCSTDSDLDLHTLRHRRFSEVDTFEGVASEPLHLHKYLYAGGDPVDHSDPGGNDFIAEFIADFAMGQVSTTGPTTRPTTRATTRSVNPLTQDATDRVSKSLNCGGWAWNVPNPDSMSDPRTGNFLDQLGYTAGGLQTMLTSPDYNVKMIKAVDGFLATNKMGIKGRFLHDAEDYWAPPPEGYHRVRLYRYSPILAKGKDFHWITQDTTGNWSGKGGPDKPAMGTAVGSENISKEYIGMWLISTPPRHGISELPE